MALLSRPDGPGDPSYLAQDEVAMTPVVRTNQLVRYYPAVRSDPGKAVDAVDLAVDAGTMTVIA